VGRRSGVTTCLGSLPRERQISSARGVLTSHAGFLSTHNNNNNNKIKQNNYHKQAANEIDESRKVNALKIMIFKWPTTGKNGK